MKELLLLKGIDLDLAKELQSDSSNLEIIYNLYSLLKPYGFSMIEIIYFISSLPMCENNIFLENCKVQDIKSKEELVQIILKECQDHSISNVIPENEKETIIEQLSSLNFKVENLQTLYDLINQTTFQSLVNYSTSEVKENIGSSIPNFINRLKELDYLSVVNYGKHNKHSVYE